MKFQTVTGSLYEVNEETKEIRRLIGVKDPQPRQGKDGVWKPYADLFLKTGESALIFWDAKTTPLLEGSEGGAPATITSPVVSIDPGTDA